ncbi:Uncharacterised protein [Serratia quinivorans]|nr:Uncharacterised protein [Serratia quinivorans]
MIDNHTYQIEFYVLWSVFVFLLIIYSLSEKEQFTG